MMAALDVLLRQGLAMVDDPPAGDRLYWFPCLQISDTASTVSGFGSSGLRSGCELSLSTIPTPHNEIKEINSTLSPSTQRCHG